MQLLATELIRIEESKIQKIDDYLFSLYRTITFCKKSSSKKLLDNFINSTTSLANLVSIKNAQMEAQNEEEVKLYHKNLQKTILFIIEEIKNGVPFTNEVQLFQLFRLVSPEAHHSHPNRYRDTLVQIGSYICPDKDDIPGLVSLLFYNITQIKNPIIRAIYFHHELIRIHPFVDGNGRVTRIAKNWMLMYHLYPPIFISNETEKKTYITTLGESFDLLSKDEKRWNEATSNFFEQELERILKNVKYILNKTIANKD